MTSNIELKKQLIELEKQDKKRQERKILLKKIDKLKEKNTTFNLLKFFKSLSNIVEKFSKNQARKYK